VKAKIITNTLIIGAIGYLAYLLLVAVAGEISYLHLWPLITLMFVLAVSLKVPFVYRIRVALILFSTGGMLFVLEAALEIREFDRDRTNARARAAQLEQGDVRNLLEITRDLRAGGVGAYPTTFIGSLGANASGDSGSSIFPLAGISRTMTVLCADGPELITYESDKHGFHNPKGLWDQEPMTIVSLGGSDTQGVCVRAEENATSLIRNVYSNTLNLGWVGTGPHHHLATLKEYVGRLKPQVVLWFFSEGDDLGDIRGYGREKFPIYGKYIDDQNFSQNLFGRQSEIDSQLKVFVDRLLEILPQQNLEELRKRLIEEATVTGNLRGIGTELTRPRSIGTSLDRIIKFRNIRRRLDNTVDRIRGTADDAADQQIAELREILKASQDYVDTWGGQIYFVYLPHWERYRHPQYIYGNPGIESHDRIVAMARSLDIPVIDVMEAFGSHPDPLSLWPYRVFGHYN